MKYISQANNTYLPVDTNSSFYAQLEALPKKRKIIFLDDKDAGVVTYLTAELKKSEAAKRQIENKQSALAKIAKVAEKAGLPLTDEELAALQ